MHLILMKGHPATGKSTLARALARRTNWPLIDKDDVKDHIFDLPKGNSLAYEISWHIAETQLSLGLSVIVDSPLSYPIAYETGRNLAARYGTRLLVIETIIDPAEWRRRLDLRRGSAHKISSWEDMQALLHQYGGCWQYPIDPEHHIQANGNHPVTEVVESILERLRKDQQD
jgi:predicted kinase